MLIVVGLWCAPGARAQEPAVVGQLQLRLTEELQPARTATTQPESADAQADATARPTGRRLRGLQVALKISRGFDDNVFRTATAEQADWFQDIEPSATLEGALGRHRLRLSYEGLRRDWNRLRGEDFMDHEFSGKADLTPHRKLKLGFDAKYKLGHDARGDLLSRPGITPEVDQWGEHGFGVEMLLGRRIAKAQIGLSYGLTGLRYFNNTQSDRNRDQRRVRLVGRWNIGPRFSALSEVGSRIVDYTEPGVDLDSREVDLLFGLAWEATAKTTGEVKFGVLNKDFHSVSRKSLHSIKWDAQVTFSPKPHSRWTMRTTRSAQEAPTSDVGLVLETYQLGWRHAFSERLQLESQTSFSLSDAAGGSTSNTLEFTSGLTYQLQRWLEIGTQYAFSRRLAVDDSTEFYDHIISFALNARFDRGE